jgi:hypothetical protein
LPFKPLLRRGATVRATVRGDALRLCPFNRLPAGIRPSVQQFQADALRHCPSDRFLSDVVADVGNVSIALPLAAARIRDELDVAFPRSFLRSPQRHLADVRLAPHSGSALKRIRLGSRATLTARWKPLVATACPYPRLPLAREPPHRHKCQHKRIETSARAPKSPLRTEAPTDTRRDSRRTSVRPNGSSHRRCRRRRPSAFVGWSTLARKRVVRDSARRREASLCDVRPDTVQRTRSARPRPKTEHVWRSSTDRRARSPLRGPLAAHHIELLEGVATSALPAPRIACQLAPQRNCERRR